MTWGPIWIKFVMDKKFMSGFSFACGFSVFQHHLWKSLSPLYCIAFVSLSKINCLCLCGSISGLSILFHWSICLFLCQYHTVLITVAWCKSQPWVVSIVQLCSPLILLVILIFSLSHKNVRISLLIFTQELCKILIDTTLNL